MGFIWDASLSGRLQNHLWISRIGTPGLAPVYMKANEESW